MKKLIKNLIIIQWFVLITNGEFNETSFFSQRDATKKAEGLLAFGGNLPFDSDAEQRANNVVIQYKDEEMNSAFATPSKFPPARNFLNPAVRKNIENSKIFKIIKIMPKGAVLHVHNAASVSADWIYENVTFRDNLYICIKPEEIKLKFFKEPDNSCEWQLLGELRKSNETFAEEINQRIKNKLSLIPTFESVAHLDVMQVWKKFEKIFDFIAPLIRYKPVFEDYCHEYLQEMYNDNIMYAEIRASLSNLYDLNRNNYDLFSVMEIYQNVTSRFIESHPDFLGIKIIYTSFRGMKKSKLISRVNQTLELQRRYPKLFAGFDLVGQEDNGFPIIDVLNIIKPLINNVPFFFHAGETDWYGFETDENVIDAALLNTKRIGHAYALLKHPKVWELIQKKHIAIEVCPISNQVLKLVEDLRDHPGSVFFAQDFPVVISNDDPSFWGAKGLSYDFYEAFMGMMSKRADIRALKKLAINSIEFSSMDRPKKDEAMRTLMIKWAEFIYKVNNKDF